MEKYLSDQQIAAQYADFQITELTVGHNRYGEGYSGCIGIEFPNATHGDFDGFKYDNFIVYDDECSRIAFDNWYPEKTYHGLCRTIRTYIDVLVA